jgi:hypothetical protein
MNAARLMELDEGELRDRVYACAKEHGFSPIGVGDLWGDILFWPETNPPYGRTTTHGVYLTPEGEVNYAALEDVRDLAFLGRRHARMPSPPRDPAELVALEEKWKEREALERRVQALNEGDRNRRGRSRPGAERREHRWS